jgi:hypothetical protein
MVGFAIFGATAAQADPNEEEATTTAGIGGAGANPRIECAWVLPDFNSANSSFDYGNDDTPGTSPSPAPCASPDSNSSAVQADDQSGTVIHVNINPNPEDLPEAQRIELWGAVDPASGVASAWTGQGFWKVFHPDGTLKVQVEGTKITPQGSGGCGTGSGLSGKLTNMFAAAGPNTTNQINADGITWITQRCQQNSKVLYYGEFDLHKYQVCGDYRVEFNATGGAATQKLNYWFNVPCVQHLQMDFSAVNYGNIIPGQTANVEGDLVWDSPACTATPGDPCPTVKNVGNSGMGITVIFTPLVQCSEDADTTCEASGPVAGPKDIHDFDACFGTSHTNIDCLGSNVSNCSALTLAQSIAQNENANCRDLEWTFDDDREQTLCANEVGKLELSIHPVAGLPSGNYEGTVTIVGFWNTDGENAYHCGEYTGDYSGLRADGTDPNAA